MIAFTLSTCLTLILTWVSGLLKWLFPTPTAIDFTSDIDNEEESADWLAPHWLFPTPNGGDSTRETNYKGEELPSWLVDLANSFRKKVTSKVACERGHAWHDLSDAILLGLSINQMVASFSLWICWLTTYGLKSNDYHVQTAVGMSMASAFSQFHVPWVLRRPSYLGVCMRLAICWLLFALYSVTVLVHGLSGDSSSAGRGFVPYNFLFLFFTQATPLCALFEVTWINGGRAKGYDGCDLMYWAKESYRWTRDTRPFTTMFVYLGVDLNMFLAHSIVYENALGVPAECSSNTPKENEWTFGNILAVGMLVALVLPAFDIQSSKLENRRL